MMRGQVTLFVIIGIILVAVVSLGLMLINGSKEGVGIPADSSTAGQIDGLIKSCATHLLPESIRYVAINSFRPKEIQNLFMSYPYHYIHGVILLPDKQVVENDLADYVSEQIGFCVDDFRSIKSDEEMVLGNPLFISKAFLGEDKVTIDIQPNITLITKTGEKKVPSTGLSFNSKLGVLYKSSEYVVNYLASDSFCVSCLQAYLDDRGLYGDVSLGYRDNELIFFFADYHPGDDGAPLITRFAVII